MSLEYDDFLDNLLKDTEVDPSLLSSYEEDHEMTKSADYQEDFEASESGDTDHFAAIMDAEDNLPEDVKASLDTLAFLESVNLVKTASLLQGVDPEILEGGMLYEDEYLDEFDVDPEFVEEYYDSAFDDIDYLEKSASLEDMSEEDIYEWALANALAKLQGGL